MQFTKELSAGRMSSRFTFEFSDLELMRLPLGFEGALQKLNTNESVSVKLRVLAQLAEFLEKDTKKQ